jgi:membrane protein required for colicin V production
MTALDWILLSIGAASALWGLMRGLVREVLSVAGWVAGFLLAQVYAPQMGAWLPLSDSIDSLRYLAGFLVVFLLVLVAFALLSMALRKLASAAGLGPLDRALGGLFGALRGWLLLLSLTIVVDLASWREYPHWQASVVAQTLQAQLQTLRPLLPAQFGKYLN